ncbi:MAG: GspH/FimT family pseudopilin [Aquabacterium sp.]|nr:GspH/FimT family pseudopilin [Aquabacterium sp.]
MARQHLRLRIGGFTLLELVIALTIVGMLGAMALPSFASLVARQRLHAAAHHLQADIALARHEAGKRAQPVHLVFQPGTQWCYVLSAGIGIDCRQAAVAPGNGVIKVVRAADHPGVLLLEATAMALDGHSGASLTGLGHARFASSEGQLLQVRLGQLGRASVCAPAAKVAGIAACPAAAPAV